MKKKLADYLRHCASVFRNLANCLDPPIEHPLIKGRADGESVEISCRLNPENGALWITEKWERKKSTTAP